MKKNLSKKTAFGKFEKSTTPRPEAIKGGTSEGIVVEDLLVG